MKKPEPKTSELVIITKAYDLILWSCQHTGKFPRKHRVLSCAPVAFTNATYFDNWCRFEAITPLTSRGPVARYGYGAIGRQSQPNRLSVTQ